jgi:hypothetical protein
MGAGIRLVNGGNGGELQDPFSGNWALCHLLAKLPEFLVNFESQIHHKGDCCIA